MAKVTSKLQVTVPKAIADKYRIRPGDEIEWVAAGDVIRVVPGGQPAAPDNRDMRLRLFDQATERRDRSKAGPAAPRPPKDRGWTREDLYKRGRTG
jgi:AbrB family looped-hinge helix DNA binding protein